MAAIAKEAKEETDKAAKTAKEEADHSAERAKETLRQVARDADGI